MCDWFVWMCWGWRFQTFPSLGSLKMYIYHLYPPPSHRPCSPLKHNSSSGRGSIAHTLQQRCAEADAHAYASPAARTAQSHLATATVHLDGTFKVPCSQTFKLGTCARTHAENHCSTPSSSQEISAVAPVPGCTVGCYYAGWLPIDKRNNPHPPILV